MHLPTSNNRSNGKIPKQPPPPTSSTSLLPPSSATTTTTTTTTSTYTTIPISTNDVISRSLHNITVFLSLRRPWPEFLSTDVFNRPESLTHATDRIRINFTYFRLNYGLLIFAAVLLSLIGTPLSLLFFSAIFALWLIFYIFREDPLYFYGHHLTDQTVLIILIIVSVISLWVTGIVQNLILGVVIGLMVSAIHGALRNPDGLFLNEDDAANTGLIGSGNGSSSNSGAHPHPVHRF